ncbi:MAG: hypothetical protein HON79_12075 [Acidiferrobacteraceae bacterium]|nr:hypothetical protein [Acidiferrobacteraceae bacterium]
MARLHGIVPIPISKEQNGYICNRVLILILHAAQSLAAKGAADPETVDRTYRIMSRGCAINPCGLMDVIGFGRSTKSLVTGGAAQRRGDALRTLSTLKKPSSIKA